MDIIALDLTVGMRTKIGVPGKYFQLVEAAAPLDVTFERNGSPSGEVARAVEGGFVREPGDWLDEKSEFHAVVLTSTSNQSVRIGISRFKGDYRRVVGVVSIESANDGETLDDQTVSNASAEISAESASRRAVHVQNVSAAGTGNVRVALGVAATTTRGVQLAPGQSVTFTSTQAVNAIREGANDIAVSVTEETRT